MTKKRFTFGSWAKHATLCVLDNERGFEYDTTETCKVLNKLHEENQELKQQLDELEDEVAKQKFAKMMLRSNIQDYERAIKRMRKSFEEFDEMRLDRIRFLEKRLKKNGLSIYINGAGDSDDR